jgi:hypothetical protein
MQLKEWSQLLGSHLIEANYIYRSSPFSEFKHAQSAIDDFAAIATYDVPAYVTDSFVLRAVRNPPIWFTKLSSGVQSFKLKKGRAAYSIWTEVVAGLLHPPTGSIRGTDTGALPTSASSKVDVFSVLDETGAAMSTLLMLSTGNFLSPTISTSTAIDSTNTATSTSYNVAATTFANAAGKELAGVAVAMIAGVAVAAVILL